MATQDDAANKQKAIQNRQDQKDGSMQKGDSGSGGAAQTGIQQPSGDFPAQHLAKPGIEAQMELKPKFMAEHYKGSGKLTGQVAIVTGGDSGIGRAVAILFAREGADVAVLYLNEHEDAAETQRFIEAEGQKCVTVAGDVKDMEFCQQAVDQIVARWGRLDILVNNAAWVRYQSVPDIAPETVDRMLDIGFKAIIWGIQAAAEAMDAERGGAIVNVASVAGLILAKNSIVYSGIKAGVMGVTRAAAAELGERNIRVNAVAPSAIPTEGTMRNRNAELDARRVARTPLGRLGTVDDIAKAICFLAGDEAGFISAQVLTVDGGITLTNIA